MHYKEELEKLASTYQLALGADIEGIKAAFAAASESSIIGVGSGGSFTVASLLCNLHESYTGRVSRAATPLEIICNPTLSSTSPVFLISAEGNNPDIVEAALRARLHSARSIQVITNRASSRLTKAIGDLTDVKTHIFSLQEKDGYLATNSLLMDAVLVSRAYEELNGVFTFPPEISDLQLETGSIDHWLSMAEPLIREVVARKNIIVVYSPLAAPVADDLESKLSEAALLHCQLADMRSFAHGRHLWLAERPQESIILAIVEPSLRELWNQTQKLLPEAVPSYALALAGSSPKDLVAGLVAQMWLIERIAGRLEKDPGKPEVPKLGRDIYYMDVASLVDDPTPSTDGPLRSKYDSLGARWPAKPRYAVMRRALHEYQSSIEAQGFRSIVFDYDGTLCPSRSDVPPSESIISEIKRLLDAGIVIGIATGRGGSIQDHIKASFDSMYWPNIHLGLYNGGKIGSAADTFGPANEVSEFLSHVTRIVGRLKLAGMPIERVRTTHPYQVSIRFRDGTSTESMWFVVADALRQAGLDLSHVVRSKHSVDVLAKGVSKSRLIAHIVQSQSIDPYEILTVGDQGSWPGNDSTLLEHRYSLSVDAPSRRLDRGWKLAPTHKRDVDATLWYLQRCNISSPKLFKLELSAPDIDS